MKTGLFSTLSCRIWFSNNFVTKLKCFILVALLILINTLAEAKDETLSVTISSITKSMPVPATNVKVSYDKIKKEVFVRFDTPISKMPDGGWGKLWAPWKLTQLLVLQEFEKAKIPIKSITVETNFYSGEFCKITNKANDIKRYANSYSEEEAWHKSGHAWMKKRGSNIWKKVD